MAEYQSTLQGHLVPCVADPGSYHPHDSATFQSLYARLSPHADSGDMQCQYAVATILLMGWLYPTDEEQQLNRTADMVEASKYWDAAAAQGSWWAVDNLINSGVGPAAERAREESQKLQEERPDLIPRSSDGPPIYGPAFMKVVRQRIYGVAGND